MSPRTTTDDAALEEGDAAPAGDRPAKRRMSRGTAAVLAALALGGAVAGPLVYLQAPDLGARIVDVELAGERVSGVNLEVLRDVLWWDFALIAGYGLALVCGAWLATAVLWSPLGKRLARVGLPLALLAIGADVLENVLLLRNIDDPRDWYLVAAAVCAVCKFCALAPAAVIAVTGWLTAVTRLWVNRRSKVERRQAEPRVEVLPRVPVGDDDLGSPGADRGDEGDGASLLASGKAGGRGRWGRGYVVPGFPAELRDRKGQTVGFCLSGGGVRSASVSIGALHSLRDELLSARYLASVSGGGYAGGAFQLALTGAGIDAGTDTGTDTGADTGTDTELGEVVRDPQSALRPGSVEEDRIRRHASYLANSPAQMLLALGVLGRTVVLSITALFGPAVLIGLLVGWWYETVPLVEDAGAESGYDLSSDPQFPDVRPASLYLLAGLAFLAFAAYAVWVVMSGIRIERDSPRERAAAAVRVLGGGFTAFALLVALLAVGLPAAVFAAAWVLHDRAGEVSLGAPLGTLLLAYGTTVMAIGRQKKVRTRVRGLFKRGAPVASVPSGALQLLLVMLALLVLAAGWLLLAGGVAAIEPRLGRGELVGILVGFAVGLGFLGGVLDQTVLSLHPFYRRRLAGAFAARRVRKGGHAFASGYEFREPTTLSEYAKRVEIVGEDGTKTTLPEPIYVAAANLTGEELAALNAVSFTFTADWVGGPDIGYVRTEDLQRIVKPQLARDLTVQAAVAISGAAVASSMGRSGRWFGTLLAVTGARLGTWLPNPSHVARWGDAVADDDWTMSGLPGVRRLPYLLREVLGTHSIQDRLLQVTDGGHYENLGLIELFRRRCDVIYCIDASGDGPPTASTLANAVTLAYEELGVEVDLPKDAWRLAPGSGDPLGESAELADLNKRLAASSVIIAPFRYPEQSGLPEDKRHGVLYVAKSSLTADLDYALLSYATRNTVFPHDSTGDQFFDDDKYCAYTGLGRALGERLRTAATLYQAAPVQAPAVLPPTGPPPAVLPSIVPPSTGPPSTAASTVPAPTVPAPAVPPPAVPASTEATSTLRLPEVPAEP